MPILRKRYAQDHADDFPLMTQPEAFALIKALLQRPIAFHRVFADVAGGAIPGLFLSQAWYWSQRTPDPDGWFYKTQAEWEEETALIRSEQDRSRLILKRLGILHEKLRGQPGRLWYSLDYGMLQTRLLDSANKIAETSKLDCRIQQPAYKDARVPETTPETTYREKEETLRHAIACERRAARDPRVVSVPETTHRRSQQPQMHGFHFLDNTAWDAGELLGYTCERYAALFAETYGHPHPDITPKKLRAIYDTLALAYDDKHLDVTDKGQVDELISAHLASTTTDGKLYAFAMLHHLGFLALGHPEQPCSLHQDFVEELGEVRRQAAERKSRVQERGCVVG